MMRWPIRSLSFHLDCGEFDRLDTLLRHQAFRKRLELGAVTVHEDHLKAPVMGDMRVERRLDDGIELVLDIGKGDEQSPLVMFVHHRDDALPFPFDIGHPLVIGDVRADRIPYPF